MRLQLILFCVIFIIKYADVLRSPYVLVPVHPMTFQKNLTKLKSKSFRNPTSLGSLNIEFPIGKLTELDEKMQKGKLKKTDLAFALNKLAEARDCIYGAVFTKTIYDHRIEIYNEIFDYQCVGQKIELVCACMVKNAYMCQTTRTSGCPNTDDDYIKTTHKKATKPKIYKINREKKGSRNLKTFYIDSSRDDLNTRPSRRRAYFVYHGSHEWLHALPGETEQGSTHDAVNIKRNNTKLRGHMFVFTMKRNKHEKLHGSSREAVNIKRNNTKLRGNTFVFTTKLNKHRHEKLYGSTRDADNIKRNKNRVNRNYFIMNKISLKRHQHDKLHGSARDADNIKGNKNQLKTNVFILNKISRKRHRHHELHDSTRDADKRNKNQLKTNVFILNKISRKRHRHDKLHEHSESGGYDDYDDDDDDYYSGENNGKGSDNIKRNKNQLKTNVFMLNNISRKRHRHDKLHEHRENGGNDNYDEDDDSGENNGKEDDIFKQAEKEGEPIVHLIYRKERKTRLRRHVEAVEIGSRRSFDDKIELDDQKSYLRVPGKKMDTGYFDATKEYTIVDDENLDFDGSCKDFTLYGFVQDDPCLYCLCYGLDTLACSVEACGDIKTKSYEEKLSYVKEVGTSHLSTILDEIAEMKSWPSEKVPYFVKNGTRPGK